MLSRMHVEHELNKRTMHRRQCAKHDNKPGAGQFACRIKVHHAQLGTEIDMIFGFKNRL